VALGSGEFFGSAVLDALSTSLRLVCANGQSLHLLASQEASIRMAGKCGRRGLDDGLVATGEDLAVS
jgi:hypothetical protein